MPRDRWEPERNEAKRGPEELIEASNWGHDMTIRANNQIGDSGIYEEEGEEDAEIANPT